MNGVFSIPFSGALSGIETDSLTAPSRGGSLAEFVAGPENCLAAFAACTAFHEPCPRYNPLVFYGPTGTGKSHLAAGIAAEWKRRNPRASVVHLVAADFARDYAEAVETSGTDELATQYRAARLFILEDAHYLAAKPAAQDELVRLIDALVRAEAQIVVTLSMAPGEAVAMTPALRSRLGAGLVIGLVPPGPATRLELVARLAQRRQLAVTPAAARLLSERIAGTVRDLSAALMQLHAVAGTTIDEVHVRTYLDQCGPRRAPKLGGIAAATARHFALRVTDLQSPSRRRQVAQARGIAMYLARALTPASFEAIGSYFGRRDHTTVLHACRRTERLLDADAQVQHAIETLRRQLVAG